MVSWFLATLLLASMLMNSAASPEEPNTDGFYISFFFKRMGLPLLSHTMDSNSTVCSWAGVTCDAQQGGRVVGFSAAGLGLSGAVPDNSIGKLSKLQSLDLSRNNITGLSSDFWGLGSSLTSLNLSGNAITGTLPNNIGNFGKLEALDLSGNALVGEIPTAVSSLSSIKILNLSKNKLNGSLGDENFGSWFKNLRSLDLSSNGFHGRIPSLRLLGSLTYLNLSNNLLQGSVLPVFQESMQVIDLSNNQFQGHLFLNSSFNWGSLAYLDLSGNELSGGFFDDFGDARSLKHLNLAFNKFSRPRFQGIEKLSGLEYLNLSKTGIADRIPVELSRFKNLKVLDLSRNCLTGSVPDLSNGDLHVIDLSMNNLTGEIPLALQETLPLMERFNFSYNNLTLCASKFSSQALRTSFIGSQNDCPIAANPERIHHYERKHRSLKLTLAIVLSLFFLITGAVLLILAFRRRSRHREIKQISFVEEQNISGPFSFQTDSTTWVADVKVATSVPVIMFEKPLLNFTFADLLAATSHFDRGTLLANGRFGPVYRGFLPGGFHAAVKVLVNSSTLTDSEAARELERLGRIKHPNLVPLSGYCLAGDQRIAIYEYMENGNLQNLLHDLPLGIQATEDWSHDTWEDDHDGMRSITTEGLATWRFRHKIALGTARALAFLHHGCIPEIVHRDLKASSIYLDSSLEPRLSDFGLAKVVGSNLEDEVYRDSPGYTPPEFSGTQTWEATTKTDVYGFGVVLFELITGKKPVGDEYVDEKESTLVGWARTLVRKNQGSRVIDSKISDSGSEKQIVEALRIAYLCTAELPFKRPSMQQIVGLLKDIEPVFPDKRY